MEYPNSKSERLATLLEKALTTAPAKEALNCVPAAGEGEDKVSESAENQDSEDRRKKFQILAERVRERLKERTSVPGECPPTSTAKPPAISTTWPYVKSPEKPRNASRQSVCFADRPAPAPGPTGALPLGTEDAPSNETDQYSGDVERMSRLELERAELGRAELARMEFEQRQLEAALAEQRGAFRKLEVRLGGARAHAASLQGRLEEVDRARVAAENAARKAESEAARLRQYSLGLERNLRQRETALESEKRRLELLLAVGPNRRTAPAEVERRSNPPALDHREPDELRDSPREQSDAERRLREENDRLLEELAAARMEMAQQFTEDDDTRPQRLERELRQEVERRGARIVILEKEAQDERMAAEKARQEYSREQVACLALQRVVETKEAEIEDKTRLVAECLNALEEHHRRLSGLERMVASNPALGNVPASGYGGCRANSGVAG